MKGKNWFFCRAQLFLDLFQIIKNKYIYLSIKYDGTYSQNEDHINNI